MTQKRVPDVIGPRAHHGSPDLEFALAET